LETTIEFTTGENTGKRIKFNQDNILVGRSQEADLTLSSDLVSYEHCRFTVKADGLYLVDLGSSNGTMVNGSRHNSGFISFGDKVAFGEGGPEAKITFTDSHSRVSKSPGGTAPASSEQVGTLSLIVEGGKSYNFSSGKIRIGRDSECDLPLDHLMVSRIHCEIDFSSDEIRIKDLNSTNGIYVNGEKVSSAKLRLGDRLTIGENGPELMVGGSGRVRSGGAGKFFKVVIPLVLIAAIIFAGYRYLYQPWSQEKTVEKQSMQDYVSQRLKQLSAQMGDPQDEIPLIFTESVIKYIEKFTSNLRNWFERSLERSEMHTGMVRRILRGNGLPEEFVYLAFVESGYDSSATSPAGARGLWQFMPATAGDFGLRVEPGVIDERIDPKKSTEAACKYIKQLYNLYNSYMLAMASYNTGPGRVGGALRRIDVIDQNRFWYLVKRNMLHNETTEYVPKIMAAMIIASDPERFGFAKKEDQE